MYLPISVEPDRCWLPYGVGPPVLPFLTCEEMGRQDWTERRQRMDKRGDEKEADLQRGIDDETGRERNSVETERRVVCINSKNMTVRSG